MQHLTLFVFIILSLIQFSCTAQNNSSEVIIISNINVIPMTEENLILENQDVIIRDGKIEAVRDHQSDGRGTIDGTGRYLIPGLTEMHAHIPVPSDGNDTLVFETLFLYLSQGVTTIRGMLGNPYHLTLRKQVAEGSVLGPRIYTSSPSMNGNSVKTPAEARQKVTQYQRDGYDFLKIHPGIQLEVWEELERTAIEVGIPYAGHVPVDVGIRRALNAGYATVDHLDGYVEGLVPDDQNVDPNSNGFFGFNFVDITELSLVDDLVQLTLDNEVAVVPTQTLFTRWFSPKDPTAMMEEPEMKYMPSQTRFAWRQNKTRMINDDSYDAVKWEKFIQIRNAFLAEMDQKGVTFLLGSDAPQVMNVPGFSLHHEMKDMADAGLSNYKILESGTSGPASFFGAAGQYGVIKPGAGADLVILLDNPLSDIQNTNKIAGVIVGGTHFGSSDIQKRLAQIEARNK